MKVFVYWTEEQKWSTVSNSAIRGNDVIPGKQTHAKFAGKYYPCLIIAKGDQDTMDKAECDFRGFINTCLTEEAPSAVVMKVAAYASSYAEEVSQPDNLFNSSQRKEHTGEGLPEPKKAKLHHPGVDSSIKESERNERIGEGLPEPKKANLHHPGVDSSIFKESQSEKRLAKLESEIKNLKEDVRSLRRKVRKLEDGSETQIKNITPTKPTPTQNLGTEKSITAATPTRENPVNNNVQSEENKKEEENTEPLYDINELEKLPTDKEKVKYLVSAHFSDYELINFSRTGKKSAKCGESARPPLNGTIVEKLTAAVTKYTSYTVDEFYKKFENIQKVKRKQAK